MNGRLLAEDGVQVGRRQLPRVKRAEPLLDHQGTREGLLHRDLLVKCEADEQGHRVGLAIRRFASSESVKKSCIGHVPIVNQPAGGVIA